MTPCKSCNTTHDEFGRLTLDPFGYCQTCIDGMREEFEKSQLEDYIFKHEEREIANEYPEPSDLADLYPVGDE